MLHTDIYMYDYMVDMYLLVKYLINSFKLANFNEYVAKSIF